MTDGILTTGAPHWLPVALALFFAGLLVLIWGYVRHARRGRVAIVPALFKAVGLAALAACLLEPLWTARRAKPGANLFVLLADNSQGMSIRDSGSQRTRGEQVRTLLNAEPSPWQVRLEQDFEVRRYRFDSRLRHVDDFHDLSFNGMSTRLGGALRSIADRFRGRPLAGILLFTDGNATDLRDATTIPAGTPPIYIVVSGQDHSVRDLSITHIAVTETAFEDAPVSVRADVFANGFSGESIVAQVLDESGARQAEEVQQAAESSQTLTFRLNFQPALPGVSFYTVRVGTREDLAGNAAGSTEATAENNRRGVVVDRGRGPYHVLYVSGRPNWEYKFLNRALDEDDQIRLLGMIRLASREPKFSFRSGDVTNPLFRGFKNPAGDDTERYDQPVLVRLNTQDESELEGGFPKLPEQLYAFHAVVIDDLESAFFSHEQMVLLRRFVSERGGGFLMLGGQESFRQGKYERTPIEELLPVYLDRPAQAAATPAARLQLTRDGWLQPWVRLRANEADERKRLDEMPEFQSVNRVRGIKPGANVLASVVGIDGGGYPALAAQRFGKGRCAALLIADLWRWQMRQDPEDSDLEKAWRQLVRWLVADVPERVELTSEGLDGTNDLVKLVARVRTESYEPHDHAALIASIRAPGGETVELRPEPSIDEPGAYEVVYAARQAGAYHAGVLVSDDAGAKIGQAETGWISDPAADEFRTIEPNRQFLQQLADQTGGMVIDASELESFAAALPARKAPVTEQWSYPIWHRTGVFLFAIACLVCEWSLRRWRGLP